MTRRRKRVEMPETAAPKRLIKAPSALLWGPMSPLPQRRRLLQHSRPAFQRPPLPPPQRRQRPPRERGAAAATATTLRSMTDTATAFARQPRPQRWVAAELLLEEPMLPRIAPKALPLQRPFCCRQRPRRPLRHCCWPAHPLPSHDEQCPPPRSPPARRLLMITIAPPRRQRPSC